MMLPALYIYLNKRSEHTVNLIGSISWISRVVFQGWPGTSPGSWVVGGREGWCTKNCNQCAVGPAATATASSIATDSAPYISTTQDTCLISLCFICFVTWLLLLFQLRCYIEKNVKSKSKRQVNTGNRRILIFLLNIKVAKVRVSIEWSSTWGRRGGKCFRINILSTNRISLL